MEAKAIEMIRDLAVASAQVTMNTSRPTAVLPSSFQVKDLEEYSANRCRFRGTFTTTSMKDYADHVSTRKGEGQAQGFVDAESANNLSCTVFFNIGNEDKPGHCDDIAILKMKQTAAFNAVSAIVDKHHSQKALSEWMEDWRNHLRTTMPDDEELGLSKSINAIRNITITSNASSDHGVGNMSSARSAMEKIEAKSVETLPAFVIMKASPYAGLMERDFVLALSVITGGEKPLVSLRWVQKEAQLEEIAQEFKKVLSAEVGGSATLLLGSFNPK
tara:strand:+ start:397 stop:1218 length:822 start_codon:yes stop_codon:yes gene_type:complete